MNPHKNRTLDQLLCDLDAYKPLREMASSLETHLPPSVSFESGTWNIITWTKTPGRGKVCNLDFTRFSNPELRDLLKVYLLHSRARRIKAHKGFGHTTARVMYDALRAVDAVIGDKPLQHWSNADMQSAERWLIEKYKFGTAARLADQIQHFTRWLRIHTDVRLSYTSGLKDIPRHGLHGTEEDRASKLVPLPVIRDLLALAARDDLPLRDQFFVMAVVLLVATGMRVNELMALPADCLVRQDGAVGLRYFVEKKVTVGVKWLASDFVQSVLKALTFISQTTESGRTAARKARFTSRGDLRAVDWPAVYQDKEATRYFLSRLLHDWTSRPRNDLFNPAGAWYERGKKHVDVIGALEKHGGSVKRVSEELGIDAVHIRSLHSAQQRILKGRLPVSYRGLKTKDSFRSDSRGASFLMIERETGFNIPKGVRLSVAPLIEQAQQAQLAGQIFPKPNLDEEFEARFHKVPQPILRTTNGTVLLEPEDALFVIERYALSPTYKTKADEHEPVIDRMLFSWLAGEARARGTGTHEESVFVRYNITDPRTGKPAKVTTHDIRHWLNTIYAEGGFTQEQIALLMGRDPAQNHVYDQTTRAMRLERLRQAIREKTVNGPITEAYHRIAEHSIEQAEDFLVRRTLRASFMPHGLCMRSLRLEPCPNHLSCFAARRTEDGQEKRGLCKDLVIPQNDPGIAQHLETLERQQRLMFTVVHPGDQQYQHAEDVLTGLQEARNATHKAESTNSQ